MNRKDALNRRDGNAPVLVFCDTTKVFDNETRSFNDFTCRRPTMTT